MNYNVLVSKIYEGQEVDFNPACFNFTEEVARAKKLWRDDKLMPTQEQLDAVQVTIQKEVDTQALYDAMVVDVYNKMYEVFGTRNDVSAQATASTYEAMVKRPASYVGELGLVDEAAVLSYASTKIAEADAYAIYRLNRIVQFQTERDAIINA